MKFPACENCNKATRSDEQLLSFISRFGDDRTDVIAKREWESLRQGVQNNFPGFYRNILMSSNEMRRFLEKNSLPRNYDIPLKHHPFVKLPKDLFEPAILRMGFKLGASLHYRHTGRIILPDGGCLVLFKSNIDLQTGGFPKELAEIIPGRSILARSSKVLNGQFSYMHGTTESEEQGAYITLFRASFALVLFVGINAGSIIQMRQNNLENDKYLVQPFKWTNPDGSKLSI